jgi:hypothetical protein
LNSSTVLDRLTVTGGYADGSQISGAVGGGGLSETASSPTIINCPFSGNFASLGNADLTGGGVHNFASAPSLTNCTFAGNNARRGGGVYNAGSAPVLVGCALVGNSAGSDSSSPRFVDGAGIYNDAGSAPRLVNCTFTQNTTSLGFAGGMYNAAGLPQVTNSIFWANVASLSSGQVYNAGGAAAVTYSDVQGEYAGVGNVAAAPLFVRTPRPARPARSARRTTTTATSASARARPRRTPGTTPRSPSARARPTSRATRALSASWTPAPSRPNPPRRRTSRSPA